MDVILDFVVIAGMVMKAGLMTAGISLLTLWWAIATENPIINNHFGLYQLMLLALWIFLTYVECVTIAARRPN
jgi:hypothetical protein